MWCILEYKLNWSYLWRIVYYYQMAEIMAKCVSYEFSDGLYGSVKGGRKKTHPSVTFSCVIWTSHPCMEWKWDNVRQSCTARGNVRPPSWERIRWMGKFRVYSKAWTVNNSNNTPRPSNLLRVKWASQGVGTDDKRKSTRRHFRLGKWQTRYFEERWWGIIILSWEFI